MNRTRREFLDDVGSGMLIAGLGATLATDLGVSPAFAGEGDESLDFGQLRPLVGLLQETPVNTLLPILVKKLQRSDTNLRELIAAAALANSETFGGLDYVGFHTEMALLPAYQMIADLPTARQALPILKVLYRNTGRIQETGQKPDMVLKPIQPSEKLKRLAGQDLRKATRAADMAGAEKIFASQISQSVDDAYNHMLWSVQDSADVHRFVLAHRAFGLIGIVGRQHAHTMLRQCVRFCVNSEQSLKSRNRPESPNRKLVPKLLDQYKLLSKKPGKRQPDDGWIEKLSMFIHTHSKAQAMDAVAAALGDGISPEVVGQAISLAANQLVLRQDKRRDGSSRCHGDSPGVHSSDSANAWRNMARISSRRNAVVGLMISAYHVAQFDNHREVAPYPHDEHRGEIKTTNAQTLLKEAETAIRGNDQGRAAAAIQIYGEQGYAAKPVFDLMLRFGISEDGRLHAEKYYRTVREEFASLRPAFRWRQLVGLARVTASSYGYNRKDEHGHRAPGYQEACRLLKVDA